MRQTGGQRLGTIAVLLPVGGNQTHVTVPKKCNDDSFISLGYYRIARLSKYLSDSISIPQLSGTKLSS